jgi:predicted nucleic acid-binding protein
MAQVKTAYVDSSCFVAIATGEPGHRELRERLSRFDTLCSSTLLEAELRSVLARKGEVGRIRNLLSWLTWVIPHQRLTREIDEVLEAGLPRGSDLWHLASAVFLRARMGEMAFLTLDGNQAEVALSLGFRGF